MTNETRLSRRDVGVLAAAGILAMAVPAAAKPAAPGKTKPGAPSTEGKDAELRALIAAHNKAFTNQDLNGVLATLSPNVVMMGIAPGELWVGHKEVSEAYKHWFQDFDPGQQSFDDLWHASAISGDMAWVTSENKITVTMRGKKREIGTNISVTFQRTGGKWLISSMHFSNLVRARA